jgi:hypothetical protein
MKARNSAIFEESVQNYFICLLKWVVNVERLIDIFDTRIYIIIGDFDKDLLDK